MKGKMNNSIDTYSGRVFDITDPTTDAIDIYDIAHALSMQCRYAGHCNKFMSVAEHCVLGVPLLRTNTQKLMYLLHDASEAYLGDVTRPLKPLLPEYSRYETLAQDAIYWAYLSHVPTDEEYVPIKNADQRMLLAEAKVLLRCKGIGWETKWADGARRANIKIRCWSPAVAERMFLRTWKQLTKAK